jgi:hypothetical protein
MNKEFPMKGRSLKVATLASFLMLATVTAAIAQDKPVSIPVALAPGPPPKAIPLKVQIVISRFEGEKKIASAPYTLSVAANPASRELARLRIGTEVPISGAVPGPPADGKTPQAGGIQYRPVGTNIDCTVRAADEATFEIQLTIEQSSILTDDQQQKLSTPRIAPAFRSFRFTNSAVLKDGQTTQFTNAADAVTGEVVRIDVTLNVAK